MNEPARAALPADVLAHERLLWGLCYRMTGSAADADDLVQDTFVRAIERPPAEPGDAKPWLVKVALNLAKDRLRARKRREYRGEWLPAPVPTEGTLDAIDEPPSFEPDDRESPARRYEVVESVSMAFLLALEALTPRQRAVVLLCDVFDHSGKDAADALGISEVNVKVTRHRARKALAAYEGARLVDRRALAARTQAALQAFVVALSIGDEAGARAVLADDAIGLSDGGRDYAAAKMPLHGAARITQAFLGFTTRGGPVVGVTPLTLNGLPALLVERAPHQPNIARRIVLQGEIGADGRIRCLYTVLADEKLAGLTAPPVA
ncbi:MAG TPA: sigma-70 family RNA polymerase sigma factor [Byssovorax sp.]